LNAFVARAPGKLVALGEYAVLEGAPAIVLAVDRFCEATLVASGDDRCHLVTRTVVEERRSFRPGERSVALVDLVCAASQVRAWSGTLDSTAFFSNGNKLGLGSSAAALTAWAGVWHAYAAASGVALAAPTLTDLIGLHRRFQAGRGSGLDVAASLHGGAIEFRLEPPALPHVGSVQLPNSVGFAGIFAGRSASTPELLAHYRAFRANRPKQAAAAQHRLRSIAEAGCAAARGDDADAFMTAIDEYGRGLEDLGVAIGAEIVTAEHRQIQEHAKRHGVAYKVSGAGGGDLGIAFATDPHGLDAFKTAVINNRFRVVELCLATQGLVVEERNE
jgi:phosphomevalonate kinase